MVAWKVGEEVLEVSWGSRADSNEYGSPEEPTEMGKTVESDTCDKKEFGDIFGPSEYPFSLGCVFCAFLA